MLYRPRPVVKKISRHKFKVTRNEEGMKWLLRTAIRDRAAAPNEKQVRRKLRRAFRERSMSGPVSVYLLMQKNQTAKGRRQTDRAFYRRKGRRIASAFWGPKFGGLPRRSGGLRLVYYLMLTSESADLGRWSKNSSGDTLKRRLNFSM